MDRYHVAVVGAGLVGEQMVLELKRRQFPLASLKVLARTARMVTIGNEQYQVEAMCPGAFDGIDVAFFAGTEGEKGASMTYAHEAVAHGAMVIDNGSDFRMDPAVPLVVPEVNGEDALSHHGIIANPNCSTIQMVVALAALRQRAKLRKVVVSTYQAVSGAGRGGVTELASQVRSLSGGVQPIAGDVFPHVIVDNVIPQIGGFGSDGYCTEETKMIKETRKILHDDALRVYPTTVRVPVSNSHAESVYVELDNFISVDDACELFRHYPGIRLVDERQPGPGGHQYPLPTDASGSAEVLVGRIRADDTGEPSLSFWVVADNVLKGAATNAVQIAEWLIAHRRAQTGAVAAIGANR